MKQRNVKQALATRHKHNVQAGGKIVEAMRTTQLDGFSHNRKKQPLKKDAVQKNT